LRGGASGKNRNFSRIYFHREREPFRWLRRPNRGFAVSIDENIAMKIALLALLGLVLGALGGAALGIGAGLAWTEIFKTSSFEGYSGMLVFFTFMPLGAAIGGIGGALLFGVMAYRDTEIAIERERSRRRDS
jgi:hypothetical protein